MSPRHFLKRYLGSPQSLQQGKSFGWLGARLHDPELWHLGRRSVAGGVSLGFFLAFIPLPIQMLIAAPLAFLFRVNLAVTMASVWITNPVTIAPMFLFAYKVGSWILGSDSMASSYDFEFSFAGVASVFGEIWQPLVLGCFICGLSAAAIGNVAVRWLWRAHLLYRRRQKRLRRLKR
ncbi:MAG: DUF2062 domain-containing protein [Gammaproteobacteria bacterium]|tara:strand:- start:21 stop:551 length:531 start_codon:yes stop_codon:yes gene_type:complete